MSAFVGTRPSVLIPKFASLCRSLVCELRNRDTSAANPKFAHIVRQVRLRTSGSKAALEL